MKVTLPMYLQQGAQGPATLPGTEISVPRVQHAEYELALLDVLKHGVDRGDRTGTGTKSLFGLRMEFDLQKGFPLITTKRVFWRGVVEELLWFLRGESNVRSLQRAGVNIWDEWASETGDLGPVYGVQWRSWPSAESTIFRHGSSTTTTRVTDQIGDVINQIKGNPESRRHIVSAWNVADLPDMALVPCHIMFQFYVTADGHLDCQLYQRSGDMFLGVPFNIASYALLTHIVAEMTGYKPGRLIHVIGDAHIYSNHIDQVHEQLAREPREFPQLALVDEIPSDPASLRFEDFELEGYDPHPTIKAPVAV